MNSDHPLQMFYIENLALKPKGTKTWKCLGTWQEKEGCLLEKMPSPPSCPHTQHKADEHRRQISLLIRDAEHDPETYDKTDTDEQNGQEGNAAQSRNRRVVHLTVIGHIKQSLAMTQDQDSRYEEPSQHR